MLNEPQLSASLPVHGLGRPLFFYKAIGSTNDRALELAREGVPHGALVVADEQTRGRGRAGRSWITRPGTGLAFSLLIRPGDGALALHSLSLNVLGALAVVEQLKARGGDASIKWPNDVLLKGRKVAGILTEAAWLGEKLECAVLGIGINVRPESVPRGSRIDYPAICVDEGLAAPIGRIELLCGVLQSVACWLPELGSSSFGRALREHAAFLGQRVRLVGEGRSLEGVLEDVSAQGVLRLRMAGGEVKRVNGGGYRLRGECGG
jgi:BirA family biotin operon repressor/biotin-[acetyl-CoA-carboxylase] ligase